MVITRDERVRWLVWLCAAAAIVLLTFYYPAWVANRNAAPDDRSGFTFLSCVPFYLLSVAIALRALFGLYMAAKAHHGRGKYGILLLGLVLTLFSFTPLLLPFNRLFAK